LSDEDIQGGVKLSILSPGKTKNFPDAGIEVLRPVIKKTRAGDCRPLEGPRFHLNQG